MVVRASSISSTIVQKQVHVDATRGECAFRGGAVTTTARHCLGPGNPPGALLLLSFSMKMRVFCMISVGIFRSHLHCSVLFFFRNPFCLTAFSSTEHDGYTRKKTKHRVKSLLSCLKHVIALRCLSRVFLTTQKFCAC